MYQDRRIEMDIMLQLHKVFHINLHIKMIFICSIRLNILMRRIKGDKKSY